MMVKTTAAPDENDNKQTTASDSLLAELEIHNDFFDDLVDMFPAKLYVQGPTGDEMYNPKYKKGLHKESKDARKARNKQAKRAKYDPSQSETTLETIRRKEEEDENKNNGNNIIPPQRQRIDISNSSSTCDNNNTTTTSRIDVLRAKLQAKIAAQRKNRPLPSDGTISKRAARRAAKQKRINDAIERNKKLGHSSTTNNTNTTPRRAAATTTPSSSKEDDLSGLSFGTLAGLPTSSNLPRHSLADNKSLNPRKKKKNLQHLLHDAEKKRQRLKELKSSTSITDQNKASRMEWTDAFKDADGQRTNLQNDPDKIKKAMKRREKKKAKSAKAWKSRLEQTETRKEERQLIRSHNLDQRKKGGVIGANLSKKRIVDVEKSAAEDDRVGAGGEGGVAAVGGKKTKRRRMGPHAAGSRAGFEGKKRDFINKKGKGETQ